MAGFHPPITGWFSAPTDIENQFPEENFLPHSEQKSISDLLKVRGATWFDYVVRDDGTLVIGKQLPMEGHANLALGQNVRAAGAVQVSGGKILQIDNSSGHYLPVGNSARRAALAAFLDAGFEVDDSLFIMKYFNESLRRWVPTGI